jgi:SulP family sulfate permease
MLKPKIITVLKDYSWEKFRADFVAGCIVAVVSLPLAIAFAIASGVSPDKGLFTAVIAGFLVSLLGGSRVQIGGPTGAFVIIVYGVVQKYGLDGLTVATCMAGVLLMIMGFAKFGAVIKFIPYPVIVGFTSGIALIIFSSQISDLLGLCLPNLPADFVKKWGVYFAHFRETNYWAAGLGALSLLIMAGWGKVTRKIPGALVALVLSTLLVRHFNLPVETIGTRFGAIPHGFPLPVWPSVSFETLRHLFPVSVTIALLAGIESLLSAVVADGMIGGKHRPNMELIAQGAANFVSPLFGGIPATGAIARTTTNIQYGGRTPVAGIVNAAVLFAIMFFFGKWAVWIPLPCLAAILVMVAYHMSEWRSFLMLMRSPKSDVAVLWVTFALTILLDLTVAIQIGALLAALLFIRRMSLVTNVGMITRELVDADEDDDPNAIAKRQVPEEVEVYEINGPFFFGAAYKFMEATQSGKKCPKVRIIRMRDVPAIDATGLHALREEVRSSRKRGICFILSDIHAQPLIAMERSGLLETIGEDRVFGNIDDALNCARTVLNLPKVERPIPFVPTVKREM